MSSASLVTAFGIVSALWFVIGAFIYVSLIRQIDARRSTSSDDVVATFGLPEGILAAVLILLLLLNIVSALSHSPVELSTRGMVASLLLTLGVVALIAVTLHLRGRSVEALAGLTKLGARRTIITGAILLFFAYPLIALSELIVQQFLGGGSSRQGIVDFFNSLQTIKERITIIIFAVTLAPVTEEFIFRFFLYGVLKRYFGVLFALIANALLFAAVHAHLPSLPALFVLGVCFTIAYEWSGSILVSMTMHSLFNAATLFFLAFPQLSQQ